MELQQEEDDFNPFVQPNKHTGPFRHPQFCAGRDNTTAEKTTTMSAGPSSSSVFNMGFMAPPVTPTQPMTPLFNKPASPSTPAHIIKATSPGREERGGSFFSFESMDTGETTGGLSLLSMFGDTTKEPEPEPPFSFSFGSGSSKESAKDSGFSFSFGGGEEGGEGTSGSIFSLF
ncbi:uncharacterized protein [Littorina saxatilis]|uniref:uncharacterized protein n=1 Tax=Littorina saxatilis TaxID=31220 RepID=UPI0038B62649